MLSIDLIAISAFMCSLRLPYRWDYKTSSFPLFTYLL